MQATIKNILLAFAALTAAGIGQSAAAAEAAAEASATGARIEEVVVVARRREESAQAVPITITAFSADTLQKQDIRNVTDLDKAIPALSLCCQRGQPGYNFVRGVPGLVGYFAEVPTTLYGDALFFDVQNISVLKGPQGTLFGTSTNGGAMLIAPKKPTDTFEGYGSVAYGNYNHYDIQGVVNVPLSDRWALRVGAQRVQTDGYVKDLSNGNAYGDEDYWIGRVSLAGQLTDSIRNELIVNHYRNTGTIAPFVPRAANPLFPFAVGNEAVQAMVDEVRSHGYYSIAGTSVTEKGENTITNIVDTLSFEISDAFTIRNVFGYMKNKDFQVLDVDGSPFRIYDNNIPPTRGPTNAVNPLNPQEIISEELQLQGKAFDDKLAYVVGTFNSWIDTGTAHKRYSSLEDAFGVITTSTPRIKGTTNALYLEGTYDLSAWAEGLSVTAGFRHTWDERKGTYSSTTIIPGLPPDIGIGFGLPCDADVNPDSCEFGGENSPGTVKFTNSSYRVGLQYQLNQQTMFYFTNSKGYSSGGFNLGVAVPELETFDPEKLNNFEIGVKTDWSAGNVRGRTNLSAYYGKYSDIQALQTTRNCLDPEDASTCSLLVVTRNAAKGEIKGVELELTLIPIDSLEFNLNAAWLDAKYTDYPSLDPTTGEPVDLSNTQFVYTPEFKYNVGFTWHVPVPSTLGDPSFRADYSWQDKTITTATTSPQFYDKAPAFDNLNASLNWEAIGGQKGLSASLYGTNLAKSHWTNGGFGAYNALGLWGLNPALPRMYGVRLRYDF